jgi:hypothetical protein
MKTIARVLLRTGFLVMVEKSVWKVFLGFLHFVFGDDVVVSSFMVFA